MVAESAVDINRLPLSNNPTASCSWPYTCSASPYQPYSHLCQVTYQTPCTVTCCYVQTSISPHSYIDPKESICQLSCDLLLTALPHFVLNVDSLHVNFGEGVKAGLERSDLLSCPLLDEVQSCAALLVCAVSVITGDVFVYWILLSSSAVLSVCTSILATL